HEQSGVGEGKVEAADMDRDDGVDLELMDRVDLVGCHFVFPFKGRKTRPDRNCAASCGSTLPLRVCRRLATLPEFGDLANGAQHIQNAAAEAQEQEYDQPPRRRPCPVVQDPTDTD